ALKVAANSLYGAFGATTSHLYNYHAASSITSAGRWIIHVEMAIARGLGLNAVYGDTDSLFLQSN
ncbi:hypothetical protein PHYSODRAFT_386538, partial [Phytophthora sojae]